MCAQKDMVIVSLIAFDFFRVKLTSDFFFFDNFSWNLSVRQYLFFWNEYIRMIYS